jgi:hypothetical protein
MIAKNIFNLYPVLLWICESSLSSSQTRIVTVRVFLFRGIRVNCAAVLRQNRGVIGW